MMFRDQVGILAGWFRGWNECEQTVALLSLLKRISRTQARFLQLCLEHSLADCDEVHLLEAEANSAAVVSQWQQEPKEKVVSLLLSHLPLLQPGNPEAKAEYMKLLQKVLAYSIESNVFTEESRQLLSYALIHPATTLEDRNSLALWLNHLEERLAGGFPGRARAEPAYHSRQGSDEWQGPGEPGAGEPGSGWQEKPPRENGYAAFHPAGSGPPGAANSIGGNANTGPTCQIHPSPLKRSMSLVPTSPQMAGEWLGPEERLGPEEQLGPRPLFVLPDHAPLSPQSSVASSGSEQTDEQGGSRNTFQEDGSGMKDVPSWLKSLRLHKYAALFSQMSYEDMMTLTEQHLESQNVTKGARHKIALSIQKLRERQSVLKSLEKDVLEGGNLRSALQELQQIILTPIKGYGTLQAAVAAAAAADGGRGEPPAGAEPPPGRAGPEKGGGAEDKEPQAAAYPPQPAAPSDGESATAPVADGDIPSQFTRVMGKVCTQLLVSRPDEENITSYLQLIEKCLTHEAFTETQKKRLLSWKQQVLKLLRTFPRKAVLETQGYRQQKGWAFGSNSLPIAGSVGMGVTRRGQRQFQLPPRALPPSRMGILSPAGIGGVSSRHALAGPGLGGGGRQSLWFANPGGSNSMPGQSRSSVQRTHSLPVHSSPQAILMFPPECQAPGPDLEINPTLESLCLSMTEHALGGGRIGQNLHHLSRPPARPRD
ncbi:protein Smaug homolog 2 isoform X1 [Ornithorhynchus anatinus]|uniref:protein Smaug homolog 2 isoform X1 n=1 Tax=Ornithorhynchus anatinus TaxID=9258 RepID=UPI0010A8196E|nr:protein Smaug homolog 2 isoform X1 [Ornithorhynchus anatinus]XP_028920610.1 protein Smaug homolog 2 isoform X1 [Ornithorhynchus anatinus]